MDSVESSVTRIRGRRVLVLGDVMLDEYLFGDCSRMSPEAPVPVLRVGTVRHVLGGAGNTAANVVSLGGRARLIARVGADDAGGTVKELAAQAGVELLPIDTRAVTLKKTRVVGQHQQIVRLDYEDADHTSHDDRDQDILGAFDACVGDCDIVVIADYAKGFVHRSLCHALIERAHARALQVIVDPRPQNRECYSGCDYLTPNWKESRALLGWPDAVPTDDEATSTARALTAQLDCSVVLTLGSKGMLFSSRDRTEELALPALAREVFDVSGAGDTVVAAFALARASGLGHRAAVALANRAASVAVGKFGTVAVHAYELGSTDTDQPKLVSRADLSPLASYLRAKGRRIVTINGSFDVLHRGHLHILTEAKKCADVLIVGVNSDSSVRTYKGGNRPIVPELDRAEMLLALRSVDYVHVFPEPDPRAFLSEVKPDVHVNGAEYGADCIEREIVELGGGRIHLVERLPGRSTTEIIDRIAGG